MTTNIIARGLTLLSTVVAPAFVAGSLHLQPVPDGQLGPMLRSVRQNLCGHPVTDGVLRALCPELPPQEKSFWDGSTVGLAVRPRGGVRFSAQVGDTLVASVEDLEAVLVVWAPA